MGDYDKIDLWLAGKLETEEAARLAQKMLGDADFAQEIRLRKAEFEVSESMIAEDIRRQFGHLRDPANMSSKSRKTNKYLWVIPLIIGFLGLLFYQMFFKKQASQEKPAEPVISRDTIQNADKTPEILPIRADFPINKEVISLPKKSPLPTVQQKIFPKTRQIALATEFYKLPDLPNYRSTNTKNDTFFSEGLAALTAKDFQKAVFAFEKIATSQPQFLAAQFWSGHAYFGLKKYDLAANTFQKVAKSGVQPFAEEAEWHFVLAQLGAGKFKNSDDLKAVCQKIASEKGHTFQAEAQLLLDFLPQ